MNQSAVKSREPGKQVRKRIDLTEGKPGRSLLMFALPMILGNLCLLYTSDAADEL